jgi:RHS repeat-associated protein
MPIPVQLSYQERGVGAAGLGWDVPLSYIRRDRTITRRRPTSPGQAPSADPGDYQGAPSSRGQLFLMLDGQRMDLVPKAAVWVARRGGAQLEVRAESDGTMTMYDGAGRTYRFNATDPRTGIVLAAGNLLLLTDITGPGGNHVRIEYTVADHALPDGSGVSIDLAKISYNPSPTTANCYKNHILLTYNPPEAAPIALSMLPEQPLVRAKTLRSIETYGMPTCGEAAVRLRLHLLNYQRDPDTQLPRLQSAQMFGQDGTPEASVGIPLGTYTYGSASHGGVLSYQKTQTIPLPARENRSGYISRTEGSGGATDVNTRAFTRENLLDLTGDGRPDWLFFPTFDNLNISISRNVPGTNGATSFSTDIGLTGLPFLDAQTSTNSRFTGSNIEEIDSQAIDVNGDGRIDLVLADDVSWIVLLNTPDPADPNHIIWVKREFFINPFRESVTARVPLARRVTGHSGEVQECYVWDGSNWIKDDNGFHNGHCPLLNNDEQPEVPVLGPELTFTEWELKDINNDGYIDLVYNSSFVTRVVTQGSDGLPPEPPWNAGVARRGVRREVFRLASGEAVSGPNNIMARLNVFGTHLEGNRGRNPFSSAVLLRAGTECGVAEWESANDTQTKTCDIVDVNGDGIADRVEGAHVYLGTGSFGANGFFATSSIMDLPGSIALQVNPRTNQCPIGTAGGVTFVSEMRDGLRDLNGDGIPDYISADAVQFGTGTGFAPAFRIDAQSRPFRMSTGIEQCDGKDALTVGGLYDMDGDGRPDLVDIRFNGTSLDIYQLVGGTRPGIPEAGRLIQIDNGYGATTKITYRSAKEDTTTPHQLPFPEIVVDSVTTTNAQGPLFAPILYAYGNASLVFDSAADAFIFPGYRRTIESHLTNGSEGQATVSDTYGLTPFDPTAAGAMDPQQRYARYALTGRPSDRTVLSGTVGSDPWSLFGVNIQSDTRRIESTHYDWGARLFEEPSTLATSDCVDMVDPYNFTLSSVESAGLHDICAAHGFVFGTSQQESRRNEAGALAASTSVATRWDVKGSDVDDFGRVLRVTNLNDLTRADDDLCVDIAYALPTGPNERVLSAVASQSTRKCTASADPPVIYAEGEWRYDGLAAGSVSNGFPTAYIAKRHSDTGALLDTVRQHDATFDASGNPNVITTTRDSDGASRTVTITYDPFGIVPVRMLTSATGLKVLDVSLTRNPLTLSLDTTHDENGVDLRTFYDGFDRPVRSQIRQIQPALQGVLSTMSYLGFSGTDPLGRRVVKKVFTDPVDPNTLGAAVGRTSTTFLDELGRSQRTELALGADYQNQTLIVGQRTYDRLGRVAFEADPYPSTQSAATAYGTTSFFNTNGTPACTVRAYGQLPFLVANTDELHEIYPTCYRLFFENNLETMSVRDSVSLVPNGPQADVVRVSYATAIGRVVARSTFQSSTRIEHATFEHDALGHLKSMTRYQDPAAAANPVTSSWHYDSFGRVLELDEPDAVPQINTYSSWGELLQVHRATAAAVNLDVRRRYDALGRVTHSEEQRNGVVDAETVNDYLYDQGVNVAPQVTPTNMIGRLAQATSPTGSISLSYDAFGRVNARVFTDTQGGTYVEKHAVHANGILAALDLFLPDSGFADEHVDYQYDSAGLGRSINYGFEHGQSQALYQSDIRDPWGRVRQAHYGPTSYAASYADIGRRLLNQVTVSSPLGSRSISYQNLDPVGRERSRTETKAGFGPGAFPSSTTSSTYDVLGRLSSALQTSGTTTLFNQQFTYDALGNMLGIVNTNTPGAVDRKLSYLATDRDRICRISVGTDNATDCNVTYDELGSIATQATPTGLREFSYLVNGRVRSVTSGSTVASYRYDALGGVQELDVTSGALVELRHDRRYGDLIAWHDGASSPELWRTIPGFDGAVATRHGNGGSWVWSFGESRGSRFFTDETGAFVQDVDYRPYGEAVSTGPSGSPNSSLYTGEQWNGGDFLASLGISQLGARLYDPAIGRFLSRDPLLIPRTSSTTNPYAFANNDPVNSSDPSGLTIASKNPGGTDICEVIDCGGDAKGPTGDPNSDAGPPAGTIVPPPPPPPPVPDGGGGIGDGGLSDEPLESVPVPSGFGGGGGGGGGGGRSLFGSPPQRHIIHLPAGLPDDLPSSRTIILDNSEYQEERAKGAVAGTLAGVAIVVGAEAVVIPGVRALLATFGIGVASNPDKAEKVVEAVEQVLITKEKTQAINVTAELIQKVVEGCTYRCQQTNVSIPVIQNYVNRSLSGEIPPAIRMEGNVLVDGVHRFIAGLITGTPAPIQSWIAPRSATLYDISRIYGDPTDWGNR